MTDLTDLLDRASDLGETPMPISDDLARAHAALRRRRRHRGLAAVGAACAVGVLAGVTGPAVLDRDSDGGTTARESSAPDDVLFAANEPAGPYTFGKLPKGWEVQGVRPQAVTIARIGDDTHPDNFIGKLVIMYDQNPPSGDRTEYNGREFFTRGDSEYTTVLARTRDGEPEGVVYVQYPTSTGWDVETMIEFLDAVRVNETARPGVG
jgi:hypothetical protein